MSCYNYGNFCEENVKGALTTGTEVMFSSVLLRGRAGVLPGQSRYGATQRGRGGGPARQAWEQPGSRRPHTPHLVLS